MPFDLIIHLIVAIIVLGLLLYALRLAINAFAPEPWRANLNVILTIVLVIALAMFVWGQFGGGTTSSSFHYR